jgi:hypothetical protein
MLDDEQLWVTGGLDMSKNKLATTEIVTLTGSKFGPDLPYALYDHCMVKINEGTIMMTGGEHIYGITNAVFNYDIESQTWTPGPDMISPRRVHACGIFNNIVVVSTGFDGSDLRSTEMLVLESSDQWQPGT